MEYEVIIGEKCPGEKVFPFTNENISTYKNIFNFENSDVLSVIGSGDQYFTSLLWNAKSVDLFDNNINAIYYFILKREAIKHLSYEEFSDCFVKNNNVGEYFKRLKEFLPRKTRDFFEQYFKNNKTFIGLTIEYKFHESNYVSGISIPYFDKSEYYRLQDILNNTPVPRIYLYNLLKLFDVVNKKYDLMLLSNIAGHLGLEPEEWYEFLKENAFTHLNDEGMVQADYYWWDVFSGDRQFVVHEIPCIKCFKVDQRKDHVLSLQK